MFFFFFFNDTATTEIYTLSLHDALPIFEVSLEVLETNGDTFSLAVSADESVDFIRSEEHTSELQSRLHLVCRLLLEKKKKMNIEVSIRDEISKIVYTVCLGVSCEDREVL